MEKEKTKHPVAARTCSGICSLIGSLLLIIWDVWIRTEYWRGCERLYRDWPAAANMGVGRRHSKPKVLQHWQSKELLFEFPESPVVSKCPCLEWSAPVGIGFPTCLTKGESKLVLAECEAPHALYACCCVHTHCSSCCNIWTYAIWNSPFILFNLTRTKNLKLIRILRIPYGWGGHFWMLLQTLMLPALSFFFFGSDDFPIYLINLFNYEVLLLGLTLKCGKFSHFQFTFNWAEGVAVSAVYIQRGAGKTPKNYRQKNEAIIRYRSSSDKEGQTETFRNIDQVGIPSPEASFEKLRKCFSVGLELKYRHRPDAVMQFAERLKQFCFFYKCFFFSCFVK